MNKCLSFAHINTRSLIANFVSFRDLINRSEYDIVAVTETWLSDNLDISIVNIVGYKLHVKNRVGHGGGVALYVKNAHKTNLLKVGVNRPDVVEQLWIDLYFNHKKYAVGVVYRPPKLAVPQFLNEFEDSLSEIIPKYDYLICGGDLNIDLLKIENSSTKLLNNILHSYDLKQVINEPTRISKTTSTLIDHIICSQNLEIDRCIVLNSPEISDHSLVSCYFGSEELCPTSFLYTYRDFKYFDNNQLLADFSRLPLWNIYRSDNIDIKIDLLNDFIINLYNTHTPSKTVLIRKPKAPWLTDNLKTMMSLRDRAYAKFKKSNNLVHWEYYKSLRNETNSAIRREKKAYLDNQIHIKNKSTIWKNLKDLNMYSKNKTSTIPEHMGNVNKINDYFINATRGNAVVDYNTVQHYLNNIKEGVGEFHFKLITEDDVLQNILTIKSNATGSDQIGIRLILYLCPLIIPVLTHIINFCFENGVFPRQWKIAEVLPIPKSNNINDLNDLRPISILPAMSKLLERSASVQIRTHLEKFSILPAQQSGFRPDHSCTTALLGVVDDIVSACDDNKLTLLILLDYSKAFDRINHRLLLAMLHYFGFQENSLKLMECYLTGRTQCVKYNNKCSDYKSIECGVPQGSILGPLLFIIYTSEFYKSLAHCKSHFYADDTQIYYSFDEHDIDTANRRINEDLKNLLEMSSKFCLSINSTKSKVMLFGPGAARARCANMTDIVMANETLTLTDVSKNLGLIMDTSLKFTDHVSHLTRRAFSNLKFIYSIRDCLNKESKIILCESLVLSHLNYGDVVFHPFLRKSDQIRLQRIQNACARLVGNIRKYDSVSPKIKELGWLKIEKRQNLHSYCLFHRILLFKTPPYLHNKIRYRTDVHTLNTRFKNTLTVPHHRTSLFKSSFTYQIAKCYNGIPDNYKIYSPPAFKSHIKKALLSGIVS